MGYGGGLEDEISEYVGVYSLHSFRVDEEKGDFLASESVRAWLVTDSPEAATELLNPLLDERTIQLMIERAESRAKDEYGIRPSQISTLVVFECGPDITSAEGVQQVSMREQTDVKPIQTLRSYLQQFAVERSKTQGIPNTGYVHIVPDGRDITVGTGVFRASGRVDAELESYVTDSNEVKNAMVMDELDRVGFEVVYKGTADKIGADIERFYDAVRRDNLDIASGVISQLKRFGRTVPFGQEVLELANTLSTYVPGSEDGISQKVKDHLKVIRQKETAPVDED